VVIGSDEITPVVRAKVIGDYLVLSAEQSEGRGLLLDRAVWAFPGEGDTVDYSDSYQTGTVVSNSANHGFSGSVTLGGRYNNFTVGAHVDYGSQSSENVYQTENNSFTSSNYHTGPLCRRYIKGQDKQLVTLFVYRMTPEGGTEGRTITVNVNLKEAKSAADGGGISYE
jgi:hypothetical protein